MFQTRFPCTKSKYSCHIVNWVTHSKTMQTRCFASGKNKGNDLKMKYVRVLVNVATSSLSRSLFSSICKMKEINVLKIYFIDAKQIFPALPFDPHLLFYCYLTRLMLKLLPKMAFSYTQILRLNVTLLFLQMAKVCWIFYLSKIVELFDTVRVALRVHLGIEVCLFVCLC